MSKIFLILLIFCFSDFVFSQGDAPALLKGQAQTSNQVGAFVQVPNSQITRINSATGLVETGNNNILVNPSFEHVTFNTGWTTSGGSAIEETSVLVHGRKAMVFVASNTVSIRQDSLLYTGANQFPLGGVQGLASIRINTTVAGLRVCPRQAGAINASLCVSVVNDGRWGLYKVPFILGGTSNGIEISSTSSVSGNIYVDDAFVGAVDLKADVPTARTQSLILPSAASTTITLTNGSITGTGLFTVSSNVLTATEDIEVKASLSITCTSNLTNEGIFATISKSGVGALDFSDIGRSTASGVGIGANAVATVRLLRGETLTFTSSSSGSSISSRASIFATRITDGSVYSSTNADTDWASCGHVPADFTGFGTVTNIETQCKREGSDLLMRGKFTTGTPTAVEARLNLKLGGTTLTSASSSAIPSLQKAGDYTRSVTGAESGQVLIEPSVGYVTWGVQFATGAGLTKATGSTLFGAANTVSFTSRTQISGWNNSNIIIGQFNGLESCSSTLECTDVFSAKVSSAGVVSGENIDWINGNCSLGATGVFNCNFNSGIFTVAPNCVATNAESSSTSLAWNIEFTTGSPTSTGFTAVTATTGDAYSSFIVSCQKQGADYIGKTAKAVASDQNIATPGVTKVKACTVSWGGSGSLGSPTNCTGSPCTEYYDSCGSVSSITRAGTGQYVPTFSNGTFQNSSPVTCHYGASNGSNSLFASTTDFVSNSSGGFTPTIVVTITSGANSDSRMSMTCQGISP